MSYKIQIEQLHLYNKKHVSIADAMEVGAVADKEVTDLKAQLANSISKNSAEALLEEAKQLKFQAEQYMNSDMTINANGKIYVLQNLLSNQSINQGKKS